MVSSLKLHNRYRIEEQLASGGMGSVYCGTDERLRRRVAIKLLREELAHDPKFVERFRREARAAAALSHPNIAGVFDYGEEEGRHFIVMELAQGRDLARALREDGPLSPERAVSIGAQACDALAHAHAAGVVHRDVKPANIILGDGDRVKVTDFGIARAAGDATMTNTGMMLGTANYISPEQAQGRPADARTDLYSMGIVLYEMLTGSVPFTGDSALAVAMRHISDDVPPPSALNPDVPAELDAVVARATTKDPAARYTDAEEMSQALRRALDPWPTVPVAAAAAMTPGSGATAVLGAGATATKQMAEAAWPMPAHGWDAARLGRAVVAVFAALLLLAIAALAYRLVTSDEAPRERPRQPAAAPTPAQEPTEPASPTPVTYTIPEGIVGMHHSDAKELLEDEGLQVDEQKVESDAPKDTVTTTNPEPGTAVPLGSTVTLYVSEGPAEEPEEEDDEGKDEESSINLPGNSENAKGKDKEKGD